MKVRFGSSTRYFGHADIVDGLKRPSNARCKHRQNHQNSSFVFLKNQRDFLTLKKNIFSDNRSPNAFMAPPQQESLFRDDFALHYQYSS
jgi:hypothetical protein